MRHRTVEWGLTNCSRVVRHGVASNDIAASSFTQRNYLSCRYLARHGMESTACDIVPEANGVAEVGGSNPLAPTIFCAMGAENALCWSNG